MATSTTTNTRFRALLFKLGIAQAEKIDLLVGSLDEYKQEYYLEYCCSVLEDAPHFTHEDEEMINSLDSDRHIDMIRLLALKYRLTHTSKQWFAFPFPFEHLVRSSLILFLACRLQSFCACGGVSVLVENMDNALEIYPLTPVNANALYELMLCMRVVVESEGLQIVLDTRGAIDVFVMCFHVDHKALALEVLNMLSVICFKGTLA